MNRSKAAKIRAKKLREKYGKDYFKVLGKKGGDNNNVEQIVATVKERYGEDYYIRLAESGRKARGKRVYKPNV